MYGEYDPGAGAYLAAEEADAVTAFPLWFEILFSLGAFAVAALVMVG